MKKQFLNVIIFLSLAIAGSFAAPLAVRALDPIVSQEILNDTDCVEGAGKACNYTLNTFVKLGISVSNIILGLVGALSLVVFMYGGFRMMTAAGNPESVSAGKKSLLGAVIGMLIVFGSYTIINFVVNGVFQPQKEFQFTGKAPKDNAPVVLGGECRKSGGSCTGTGTCKGTLKGKNDCGTKQECCFATSSVVAGTCLDQPGFACQAMGCQSGFTENTQYTCASSTDKCCQPTTGPSCESISGNQCALTCNPPLFMNMPEPSLSCPVAGQRCCQPAAGTGN